MFVCFKTKKEEEEEEDGTETWATKRSTILL